jgi:hypothetical protein
MEALAVNLLFCLLKTEGTARTPIASPSIELLNNNKMWLLCGKTMSVDGHDLSMRKQKDQPSSLSKRV